MIVLLGAAGITLLVVTYLYVARLAYLNFIARDHQEFPTLPPPKGFMAFMSLFWPVAWPTSYLAYDPIHKD